MAYQDERMRFYTELLERGIPGADAWLLKQAFLDGFFGVPIERVKARMNLQKHAFLGGFLQRNQEPPELSPEQQMEEQERETMGSVGQAGTGALQYGALGGALWGAGKLGKHLYRSAGGRKQLWKLFQKTPTSLMALVLAGAMVGATKPLWGSSWGNLYPE